MRYKLTATVQGVRGGKYHTNRAGYVRVSIREAAEGYELLNIYFDQFTGESTSYKERDKPLIHIQIPQENKPVEWTGTIDGLRDLIQNAKP